MTHREIASLLGVGENAVGQWCAAYRQAGDEGLEVRPQGRPLGVGRRLTSNQEIVIQAIVSDATPQALGIPLAAWTRKAVRDLIQKRYRIALSLQSVGQYLARWNMTPQKPARKAKEQDEEEVREFVEETLPEALKQADQDEGQLHFADETGAQVADQIGAGYARKGQTPEREVPKTRIKQSLISSVTPEGDLFSWLFPGTMNADTFLEFLERLVAWADRKVFLFLDHHPAHKAKKVEAWVSDHSDQIQIVWLPTYSPEYNPDEFLNNDLKQNLENQPLPETSDDFRDTLRRILDEISGFPERVMGYFRKAKLELGAV
jgi:transposase